MNRENRKSGLLIFKIAGAVIISGAIVMLYGCKSLSPSPLDNQSYDIDRPPVEAPTAVKVADFRLNPPEVLDMSLQKVDSNHALLMVRFAPDKRLGQSVTITTDDGPITLHNDGGVFTGTIFLDVDAFVTDQENLLKSIQTENEKRGPLVVHRFRGRDIVGEEEFDFKRLDADLHANPIRIPPFLFGERLVRQNSSLFITDTNVVADPTRTFDPCTGVGTQMGAWTFGYLMTQMANQQLTQVDPSDFVMNWLTNWLSDQTVNGFNVQARPAMQTFIDGWPKLANGKLDLTRAPMKLLAIVNRIDLAANSAYGPVSGAEGRFIFAPEFINGQFCGATSNFNVIVEYGIPVSTCGGIRSWANQWLNLQNFQLGSSQYNAALEAITDQFTSENASLAKPNGSALDQLRTDEIEFNGAWQLREFHISGTDHLLHEATIAQTPDQATYNGEVSAPNAALLGEWINDNAAAVAANTYTVPLDMESPPAPASPPVTPFLGGEVTNVPNFWNANNISTESTRHNFSLNTCNACHGQETGTAFTQVFFNSTGATGLSGFLTGINNVTVPVNGAPDSSGNPVYSYNDLERRAQILSADANSLCFMLTRVPVGLFSD